MNRSPLLWIGVTLAATGIGTGARGLLYVGLALAAVGFVGKERLLQALPPELHRQIRDALLSKERSPAIPPGMTTAPLPTTRTAVVAGPDAGQDILLWF